MTSLRFRSGPGRAPRGLASDAVFAGLVAVALVAVKLWLFDYLFFTLRILPNHDMYVGAPLFATNLHAWRLGGDLAWWNPIGGHGYAQHYQSFLSPLAPTPHHVAFIVWAHAIGGLAALGLRVPEYTQYLVVTYVVLPTLAVWAFTLFATLLFRSRAVVLLVATVYVLSGIGLWSSAWFYFQEPFSLFLLLAALVAALQRPSPSRLTLLLAALLLQLTSANYWTVYNAWFLAILLGSYAVAHPGQVRRLGRRARTALARHRGAATLALSLSAAALVLWGIVLGSIFVGQSGAYVRSVPVTVPYTMELRNFTTELFDPSLARSLQHVSVNELHNARYIGVWLLPLLVLVPLVPWRRRERWLVLAAVLTFVVGLGPPLLVRLWQATPFVNQMRHLFHFYTQYFQILLVLLAGCALDRLLAPGGAAREPRRLRHATVAVLTLSFLALVGHGLWSNVFPPRDPTLQANLTAAALTLVAGIVILQRLLVPGAFTRGLLAGVILILALADLGRYYNDASHIDQRFTTTRWNVPRRLPPEVREAMQRPWRDPNPAAGFDAGLAASLPVPNVLWPENHYVTPRAVAELQRAPDALRRAEAARQPLRFHAEAVVAPTVEAIEVALAGRAPAAEPPLLLQSAPRATTERPAAAAERAETPAGAAFEWTWRRWSYNGFGFDVTAPRDGWLYVRQLHDGAWRVTIDGARVDPVRANLVGMAVPLARGRHDVQMEYMPLARRLYGPACGLLVVALVALGVIAFRVRPRRRRGG